MTDKTTARWELAQSVEAVVMNYLNNTHEIAIKYLSPQTATPEQVKKWTTGRFPIGDIRRAFASLEKKGEIVANGTTYNFTKDGLTNGKTIYARTDILEYCNAHNAKVEE